MAFRGSSSRGGGDGDWPGLDPQPQELTVLIEAKFTARGMSLG